MFKICIGNIKNIYNETNLKIKMTLNMKRRESMIYFSLDPLKLNILFLFFSKKNIVILFDKQI